MALYLLTVFLVTMALALDEKYKDGSDLAVYVTVCFPLIICLVSGDANPNWPLSELPADLSPATGDPRSKV